MKIVISTDGEYVSEHFGRCPNFTIVNIQNNKIVTKEIIANPGHHPSFLPQYFNEKGANCIISGGMGQRAQILFNEKNIQTIMGVSGKIDDILEKFCNETLQSGNSLCKPGDGRGYGINKTECDHENHNH
jgi:predicted Fe-Mo cluster-binding NifX family protein